jgi:UDP-N-acetyl-D-glucosamine dehydrogenase
MLSPVRVDAQTGSIPSTWDTRIDLKSVALNAETLLKQDCVVLVTDHDAFDYESIAKHSKLLVDTRGRYPKPAPNIVKA